MAPILDIEVECGEQKSRLLRGMVVLRGTVNYCNSKDGKLIRPVREERHEWTHANVGTSRQNKRCHSVTGNGLASNKIGRRCKKSRQDPGDQEGPGNQTPIC